MGRPPHAWLFDGSGYMVVLLSWTAHMPTITATIASFLSAVWFGVQLWDFWRNKVREPNEPTTDDE